MSKSFEIIADQLAEISENWDDFDQSLFNSHLTENGGVVETPSFDELAIQFRELAKYFASSDR